MILIRGALIIAIAITVAIFAIANLHYTVVSLVIGSPVEIRMIVLLMSAYLAGVVTILLYFMVRRVRRTSTAGRALLERGDVADIADMEDFD